MVKLDENGNKIYYCECGAEFNNAGSLGGHSGNCEIHLGHKPEKHGGGWNKGLTKETDDRIKKSGKTFSDNHKLGLHKKFTGKGSTPEIEAERCRKLSIAAKKNGFGGLNDKIGRGSKSILIYKNQKFLFRSSYEFVYGLYLAENDIDFKYENITLPAIQDNNYSKTFTNDFNIGNKIIEIKGVKSNKDSLLKNTFESSGYIFEEIFDIEPYEKYLIDRSYPIKEIEKDILKLSKEKNYFTYDFSKKEVINDYYIKDKLIKKILNLLKIYCGSKLGLLNKNNKYTMQKTSNIEWENRKNIILNSGIDLMKHGWCLKIHKITGLSRRIVKATVEHFNLEHFKIDTVKINQNNNSTGKHWYKNPNTKENNLFIDGEQPKGWIKGKYQ